jgi:hypothetical protein
VNVSEEPCAHEEPVKRRMNRMKPVIAFIFTMREEEERRKRSQSS